MVILGGGFGGLAAARGLARAPVDITLVDRSNHHLFQPLLYQVATALLPAPDIAAPLRSLLSSQKNCRVLLGQAEAIDPDRKEVRIDHGEVLTYDHLILATGLTHHYFGHDEWREHAPGLKTLSEAVEMRNRILLAFEVAERVTDPEARATLLTFVVVGGGATGVELAGQVAEISHQAMKDDFRRCDPTKARIILVEGAERIFRDYHPRLSERARRDLESLGVEVRTQTKVVHVDGDGVNLDSGDRISTHTVLWAAGVKASPLTAQLGTSLDPLGRVQTTPECTVREHDDIHVLGDLLHFEHKGQPLPAVAQVALQSGALVAKNIQRRLRGEPPRPFRYFDKGLMATIGYHRAIVESRGVRMSGYVAWLAWLVIHIVFLVTFRNRVFVMFRWFWASFSARRSSRVVFTDPTERAGALFEQSATRDLRTGPRPLSAALKRGQASAARDGSG